MVLSMRPIRNACLVLLLGVLIWGPAESAAQAVDKFAQGQDERARRAAVEQYRQAYGQSVAACEPGEAFADLDANNVRARLYNTGQLFRGSGGVLYEVPKGSNVQSIFASGIWIGGMAGDELRMAAATYAQGGEDYEFFPGPLDLDGNVLETFSSRTADSADVIEWIVERGRPVDAGGGGTATARRASALTTKT